jgi:hypothetical protein
MQQAFGADVRLTAADVGLYLVVSSGSEPDDHRAMNAGLRAAGAAVAARISPSKVLAVMPYHSFEALRADRAIGLVGPVHLDPARFALFERAVAARPSSERQTPDQ